MSVAVAAAVVASSPAAAPKRTLLAPARITGLAADGGHVAFAVASRRGDCAHVRLWTPATGRVVRFGPARACGPATSTGSGLVGPTLARTRALWLTYTGGNIREWSLWSASLASPRPRRVRFVARDVDSAAPLVLGEGDASRFGYRLPYAEDDVVSIIETDTGNRGTYAWWRAPERIVAVGAKRGTVAAAFGNQVGVLAPDGTVETESFRAPVDRIVVEGDSLLVQYGRTLERRGAGSPLTWTLAPGARLADAEEGLAVYVLRGAVHVLRLVDGRDVAWTTGARTAFGQLDGTGLVVAADRRLTIVPRSAVLARLGA